MLLEISEIASKVMYLHGVKSIITGNLYDFSTPEPYDTLLLTMNTIGLTGDLQNLDSLFSKLKKLIKPNGQILFDSSNIGYLYEGEIPTNKYYGEMDYQYEYGEKKSDWFKWLYVDFDTAKHFASKEGLALEIVFRAVFGKGKN